MYHEYLQQWIFRFAGPGIWHANRYDELGFELDLDGWNGGGTKDDALDWLLNMG
jgi:hypothetical protein